MVALGPRARTFTVGGTTSTVRPGARFLSRTAKVNCRSSGAWRTSTLTSALRVVFNRTPWTATPSGTVDLMADLAAPTQTGSVIASVTCRSELSGPTTSTVLGCDEISPTMKPGAGSPSTVGCTDTTRVAEGSKRIPPDAGVTWVTSTANGAFTRSGEM